MNEITESDLLVHIVDISHPNYEEHIDSVNEILGQIDSSDKPLILVYNKIDSIDDHSFIELNKSDEKEYISAQKKININQLKEKIFKHVRKIHVKRFPYNKFLYPDID